MKTEELKKILDDHKLWLECGSTGKRADLQGADLQGADLQGADLQNANLRNADLRNANLQGTYLQGANLRNANLRNANLQNADLQNADLQGSYLQGANLRGANLRNADLRNANLDFSCWPLWCGSLGVKIDDRLKIQLMYHMIDAIGADKFNKKQIDFANKFHRVGEAPKLEK